MATEQSPEKKIRKKIVWVGEAGVGQSWGLPPHNVAKFKCSYTVQDTKRYHRGALAGHSRAKAHTNWWGRATSYVAIVANDSDNVAAIYTDEQIAQLAILCTIFPLLRLRKGRSLDAINRLIKCRMKQSEQVE